MTDRVCEVRQFDRYEQLDELQMVWHALLAQTAGATFFHTIDWLRVYWRHHGAAERPRVLVTYHDGRPFGIVPLVVVPEPNSLGTVRTLGYPLRDWGPYFSPIGPHPTAALIAALDHVRRQPRDWDLLELRWIHRQGWDGGRTANAFRTVGMSVQEGPWAAVAELDLRDGWDRYWATRTRRWRKNVRRCERRLKERGEVTFERWRAEKPPEGDGDPNWPLYECCEQIAAKSWQGSSQTGYTMTHDEVRPFMRDVHVAAAGIGAVDISLLRLNGAPAAYVYSYVFNDEVMGIRMGFDPALAQEGAGTVLMQHTIADSCRRGDASLNLGAGYLDCKRYWQTSIEETYRCTHFPRAPLPQLIRLKRACEKRLRRARRNPARFGLTVMEETDEEGV